MNKAFLIFIILLIPTTLAAKPCKCESPEEVLKYYYKALRNKDVDAIKSINWTVYSFQIGKIPKMTSYKVIKKITLKKDMKIENVVGDLPIWARKGTVKMDVLQRYADGKSGKYYYSFRKIKRKWYMVRHTSEFDSI